MSAAEFRKAPWHRHRDFRVSSEYLAKNALYRTFSNPKNPNIFRFTNNCTEHQESEEKKTLRVQYS